MPEVNKKNAPKPNFAITDLALQALWDSAHNEASYFADKFAADGRTGTATVVLRPSRFATWALESGNAEERSSGHGVAVPITLYDHFAGNEGYALKLTSQLLKYGIQCDELIAADAAA